MKHLFYVQSNLSSLVCQAIITRRGIAAADVVFLLNRGISGPAGFHSVAIPDAFRFPFICTWRKIPRNIRAKRAVKTFVNALVTDSEFEFYVNRMNYDFIEIVESMPGFRQLNLYEEGLGSYYTKMKPGSGEGKKSTRTRAIEFLSGYGLQRPRRSFYSDGFHSVYATSPKAFEGFPRRNLVDLKAEVSKMVDPLGYPHIPRNSLVCVLPMPYAFMKNSLLKDRLIHALSNVLDAFRGRSVLFKPHPDVGNNSQFWESFYSDLSQKTKIAVQDHIIEDLPLERLAMARRDVVFCVVISSLAVYASRLDMKLISIAPSVFGEENEKISTMRRASEGIVFWEDLDSVPQDLSRLIESAEVSP